MPEILRFRSTWGIEPTPNFENYKTWFAELKQQGYAGIEANVVNIGGPGYELSKLKKICDDLGLKITTVSFSAWPNYEGPKPAGLGPQQHLAVYKELLQKAAALDPVKCNVQSGADHWSLDQSVEFYKATFAVDAKLGLTGKVCHETHRNRSLFNPYTTARIVKAVPELRITADISHHVVCCERLLDVGEEDKALLETIIPHVHHIHTRIGTTQASQSPDPTNEVFKAERTFFENFWKRAIESSIKKFGPETPITFVPEYGPFPYHPHGSDRDFSEVCDTEGGRLQTLFEEFVKSSA